MAASAPMGKISLPHSILIIVETSFTPRLNQVRKRKETTFRRPRMRNPTGKQSFKISLALIPCMGSKFHLQSNRASTKSLPRMLTPCVSVSRFIESSIVSYDLAHNPDLYRHSMVGRSKENIDTNSVSSMSSSVTSNSNFGKRSGTSHWKSTYKTNVDEATSQPASRAMPPQWSLPR